MNKARWIEGRAHVEVLGGKNSTHPKNGKSTVGSCSLFTCAPIMASEGDLPALQFLRMGLWPKGTPGRNQDVQSGSSAVLSWFYHHRI